jgi:ubiquinone/menaquinone biosynthesis C-methylase UbiE
MTNLFFANTNKKRGLQYEVLVIQLSFLFLIFVYIIIHSPFMEFKDYFSTQAEVYIKSRPSYPDELFKFLVTLSPTQNVAWDCATGNGQAAVSLANYFKKVIATDASQQQINNAVPHENVDYSVALGDNSDIETSTVDLVTIATALHWMNFDTFYKEVDRVLKPGGIFAAWLYCDSHVDETIDKIVKSFSKEVLGKYWPPESTKYVFSYYRNIPFPYKLIKTPTFKTSVIANLDFLIGNLYSWSATQKYIKATGNDPVELIKKDLEKAWGDVTKPKKIKWKMVLKVGRKE